MVAAAAAADSTGRSSPSTFGGVIRTSRSNRLRSAARFSRSANSAMKRDSSNWCQSVLSIAERCPAPVSGRRPARSVPCSRVGGFSASALERTRRAGAASVPSFSNRSALPPSATQVVLRRPGVHLGTSKRLGDRLATIESGSGPGRIDLAQSHGEAKRRREFDRMRSKQHSLRAGGCPILAAIRSAPDQGCMSPAGETDRRRKCRDQSGRSSLAS